MEDKYLIITKKENKYKITYIYYGSIFNGLRVSKEIGRKSLEYKEVERIYDRLNEIRDNKIIKFKKRKKIKL